MIKNLLVRLLFIPLIMVGLSIMPINLAYSSSMTLQFVNHSDHDIHIELAKPEPWKDLDQLSRYLGEGETLPKGKASGTWYTQPNAACNILVTDENDYLKFVFPGLEYKKTTPYIILKVVSSSEDVKCGTSFNPFGSFVFSVSKISFDKIYGFPAKKISSPSDASCISVKGGSTSKNLTNADRSAKIEFEPDACNW